MTTRRSEISDLRNLGGKSEEWLNAIGVFTRQDLERLGSVEIYRSLKEAGFPVSLNLVWGIEGALADLDWRDLPADLKAELRAGIRKL
ncbi:MAG: TfoX/Sxy family protein [Pyrinomonadaceae bacterium]